MKYPYSLIANLEGKGRDFASAVYQELQKRSSEFELNPFHVTHFRDGEFKTQVEKNVRRKICFFLHDSNEIPSQWFAQLLFVNQSLRNSSASETVDVLPYLKFSRQDRKDQSRTPISARALAHVIEDYADRVVTLDVHNPALQGFYDIPFDPLHSYPTVVSYLRENHPAILDDVVVMSTDAGGAKRAQYFANSLEINDVVVGYKIRPSPGEVGSLRILGDVKGKNVLIVDDLVDSGGTLIKACESARMQGARSVSAYATHGLFTEGNDKVASCLDNLFVGDTLLQQNHPKLEVISFAPLFAEAIYRISEGESLSALFT